MPQRIRWTGLLIVIVYLAASPVVADELVSVDSMSVRAMVHDRCNLSTAPLQLGSTCHLSSPSQEFQSGDDQDLGLLDCTSDNSCYESTVHVRPLPQPVLSTGQVYVIVF
jgi:hypothetical protein